MADAAACVNAAPASPVKNAMPTAATDAPSSETPVFVATRISHRANGLRHTVNATKPSRWAPAVSAHRAETSPRPSWPRGASRPRRSASKGANESAIDHALRRATPRSACRDETDLFSLLVADGRSLSGRGGGGARLAYSTGPPYTTPAPGGYLEKSRSASGGFALGSVGSHRRARGGVGGGDERVFGRAYAPRNVGGSIIARASPRWKA